MKIISTTRLSIKVAIWATLGLLGLSTTLGVQQLSATASQTPVITSVTSDASQQITVNWTPPTDLDFTGYIVRYRMSTATDWEEASLPSTSATSYIVNGLTNSTAYQVQLGAVYNAELVVSAISNDVVPYGLPNAPVMTELVSEASGELTVRWTAPSSDGGSVVTEYKATTGVEAESCTVSSSATECTIPNLVNGTSYSVTVAAKNARGYGAASSSLSTTPYGVAGAPTGVSGVAGNQQVVVSWTAPASNNGSVVTGYVVTGSPSGGSCSATGLTCTVTGLTNGTSYTFSVKAANARGDSVASASSTAVIPVTTPSAPTSLVATAGDAAATITFAAPSSTGGASITNYKYSTDGVNWKLLSPVQAASPVTISEQSNSTARLVNGTVYQIKLRAVNSAGDGLESDAVSVTPVFSATTPGAPTNVVAIAGNASASIEFTAPSSTGGADITNYKYSTDGGISFTALVPASTSTPIVITGLVNGTTYQVKLRAVNSVGDGTASSTVSVTPTVGVVLAVPGAPTNVVATTGNASASVAFTAPSSTGGAPILEYIVRAIPATSGQTKTCSTTTTLRCELTGLTNNVEYTVVVVARNSVGESANSNSISIFPVAPPSVQVLQSLPESLALPNSSPAPGESIVLTFSGFTPFEWVVITLQSTPTVLNSLQADSSGVITTSVVLPSSTSLGSHTLSLLGLTSGTGARKTITVSSAAQSSFISLSEPKRVVDTRGGGRFGSTSVSKVSVKRVKIAGATTTTGGATGLPLSGVGAVALNVTAVNGFDDGGYGFVTVYPCESDSTVAPNSSNLNFAGGQTIPNAVIAPVSSNGYVCFSVYGNTDLLVDVSGYFPSGSGFSALSEPKRVVDTRGGGRFGSTSVSKVSVKRVKIAGATTTSGVASGLPLSGVGAVALNVTAVNGFDDGGYGFVTVYPCESDSTVAPNSSNLNFAGGQTIPNAVIAPVSSNGYVCFSVFGNTDLLVDVSGYFPSGSGFSALSEPKRVVDTRGGGRFGSTSVSKVSVKRVKIAGATTTTGVASGLPSSGVGAVALNVTAVEGFDDGGYGFVTVYPCESDSTVAPNSSNLNFAGGQTIPNAVIAPVSADGYVCFSVYGNTDLLVDVSGYFGS